MALKKVLLIIISCSVGDAVGKYKKVLPLHPLNCTVFPFFSKYVLFYGIVFWNNSGNGFTLWWIERVYLYVHLERPISVGSIRPDFSSMVH